MLVSANLEEACTSMSCPHGLSQMLHGVQGNTRKLWDFVAVILVSLLDTLSCKKFGLMSGGFHELAPRQSLSSLSCMQLTMPKHSCTAIQHGSGLLLEFMGNLNTQDSSTTKKHKRSMIIKHGQAEHVVS